MHVLQHQKQRREPLTNFLSFFVMPKAIVEPEIYSPDVSFSFTCKLQSQISIVEPLSSCFDASHLEEIVVMLFVSYEVESITDK